MRSWLAFTLSLVLAGTSWAGPFDIRQRSISGSKQFFVYSADVPLRSQVAGFADELRSAAFHQLGLNQLPGNPIVITLDRAAPSDTRPPVDFSLVQVEGGFKVQIDVRIGEKPEEVNLQKQILRALFLELAYRDHPADVRGGEAHIEPPWWLVEGTLQILRKRDAGVDSDLFKRIIDTNKLPPIETFLGAPHHESEGSTVLAIDQACAMCLVQSLLDQPSGHENLTRFIQHLASSKGDPVADLVRDFPSLNDGQGIQKWWTLNLARFSAADRFQGLSLEESDAQLQALLQFEIPLGKGTEKKTFSIADFDSYLKLPGSKAALQSVSGNLLALSTQANPLYRGIIADYQETASLLLKGKTHGLKDRLSRSGRYREALMRRLSEVEDYMNWFEATQTDTRSQAFDGYLKAANELSEPLKHDDPISKYLDDFGNEL